MFPNVVAGFSPRSPLPSQESARGAECRALAICIGGQREQLIEVGLC